MRALLTCVLLLVACRGDAPSPSSATRSASAPPSPALAAPTGAEPVPAAGCDLPSRPWKLPAPARLVAIGDLHGDLAATRRVLVLAGAIDDRDRWIGGDLVVVQTGDVLDRGDDEEAILELLARLSVEADKAGGALIALDGNHELMNAAGDLRYVTPGGFADFADSATIAGVDFAAAELVSAPPLARARIAAFRPGGPWALRLADQLAVVMVGDTVFAHGGVEPAWATRIDEANQTARCWLAGHGDTPAVAADPDGPLWSRDFSEDEPDCARLREALDALGARRMVVGHTPQPNGITSACDGAVWRIDVGLAAHYGGPTQALQIAGDQVSVLGT